jgi:hypothetical protein
VISIYVGISIAGKDNSEAIQLKNDINMLDKAIANIQTQLKTSDATLKLTEKKYQNFYIPYDQRCVHFNQEFLKKHGY